MTIIDERQDLQEMAFFSKEFETHDIAFAFLCNIYFEDIIHYRISKMFSPKMTVFLFFNGLRITNFSNIIPTSMNPEPSYASVY